MDCALFLSKIIHHDLVVGNATAWQFWNAWEPGRADAETRYYLLALKNNLANTEGDFTVTKNLWALGHFSRFVRPGMQRLATERSDGLNDILAAKDVLLSAYTDGSQLVIVAVNYTKSIREINLELPGIRKLKALHQYVTTALADDNMKSVPLSSIRNISLQPRSIATIIMETKPQGE